MTDKAPYNSPDTLPNATRENSNTCFIPCQPEATAKSPNTAGAADGLKLQNDSADSVEDGVALHIVPSHNPGTIFSAVAEPAYIHNDSQFPEADADSPDPKSDEFFLKQKKKIDPGQYIPLPKEKFLPNYNGLAEVAAVRVSGLGPMLFFTTDGLNCKAGDKVIVGMEEGQAYGVVVNCVRADPVHMEASGEEGTIRPLLRHATDNDVLMAGNNEALVTESFEYCRDCIRERNLDMKLVDVLVMHDRSKMIFYFTAPARIDFRELVKDLVRRYRTRIELRQIGVRHETQMVGALGNCGMVCCCRRYLRKFAPVAIKMAKEQNVFLNPVKISGICGRLLCCLAYEQEHYDEFYRSCPKLGKKYQTDTGIVRVLRASLFRESVTVLTEVGEEVEYSLSEWGTLHPFRPNAPQQILQEGKKQEIQGGYSKQRKNEGRDRRPNRPHHDAHELVHDLEPDSEADVERKAICPEKNVVAMGSDGIIAALNSMTDSDLQKTDLPDPEIWDSEDIESEDDSVDDNGESIFGLTTGRQTMPSGRKQAGEGPRHENTHRRKYHNRRKPRSDFSA